MRSCKDWIRHDGHIADSALHTLDFPVLLAHPHVRSTLVVGLCALGFVFSLTGIVIGWRRLRYTIGV